jgi:hypothetical protein
MTDLVVRATGSSPMSASAFVEQSAQLVVDVDLRGADSVVELSQFALEGSRCEDSGAHVRGDDRGQVIGVSLVQHLDHVRGHRQVRELGKGFTKEISHRRNVSVVVA